MPDLHLHRLDGPGTPRGLVLMLHGGQEAGFAPVDGRSATWRRARWMQRQIAGRLHARGVTSWLLRFGQRGWNAGAVSGPSPVPDARWALEQVRSEFGRLPVVLLGHSMGARTAVAVADDPLVKAVVALAPWLPDSDPVHPLEGKHLAAAHGTADRITSYEQTEAFVRRASSVTASAGLTDMGPVGHYMLRRVRAWNEFAVDRSLSVVAQYADH